MTMEADVLDRQPPNSIEAEQGVLGCCLLDSTSIDKCSETGLLPHWFFDLRHRTLWDTLRDMREAGMPTDLITLVQNLKDAQQFDGIGGLAYISGLQDAVPSAANLSYYTEILREKFQLRRVLATASGIAARIQDSPDKPAETLLEEAETSIREARSESAPKLSTTAKRAVHQFLDKLQDRFQNKDKLSGIPTGFKRLDTMLDGLQLAELTLIAARPSIGKTSIGASMALTAAINHDIPTLFITLEMSESALVRRMVSDLSGVSMKTLRSGNLTADDFRAVTTATAKIAKAPIFFEEAIGGAPVSKIVSMIRRAQRQHGVQLVVIDYIQKIQSDKTEEKRTYEIANVSGALQRATRSTGVAILALAQLNRENEKGKGRAPTLTDLADSKQLEQDADTVILLHRKREEATGDALLIVAKQRDGECDAIKLGFDGRCCRFTDQTTAIDHDAH